MARLELHVLSFMLFSYLRYFTSSVKQVVYIWFIPTEHETGPSMLDMFFMFDSFTAIPYESYDDF